MRFIECYVEGFGKLRDFKYTFKDGLNVIHAENGYGKTTLSAFIKCMLYGMEDTKKQDLSENDRKHYMPWQGGVCGGSLTVEHGGKRYKIERRFASKAAEDTFALYNLETGRLSDDYPASLGEEILGIDRDGFERTLFLSERRLSGKNDNKSISARLSELVGCDGDIGGVDAALKRLEEKRKYYKKTGGRGYIDELAAKLSVCAREISALEHAKDGSRELESMLVAQRAELAALEEKHRLLEGERDAMRLEKSKQALSEQYTDQMAKLSKDRARMETIRTACGGRLPSSEEIDGADYKLREAKRLEAQAEATRQSAEYEALAKRFDGRTDLTEIERAAATAERLSTLKRELADSEGVARVESKYFSKRIPKKQELLSAKRRGGVLPLILGIAAIVAAIPLFLYSKAIGLAAAALGALLLGVAAILSASRKRKVKKLLLGLSHEPLPRNSERRAYLDMLITELDRIETEREGAKRALMHREALLAEAVTAEASICELLTRLGLPSDDPIITIAAVRLDFIEYYKLSLSAKQLESERHTALERAAVLRGEAEEFLGRFSGLGDAPFDTLKRMLAEYSLLSSSVSDRARECAALRERYGIKDGDAGYDPERLSAVETELRECEGNLAMRRREITASELRLANESESYERIYEIRERANELAAKKAEAEEALDAVLGAKKYITAAMENMTTKYLGKTRDGFAKYRKMIDDSEREFLMDTSFALSVGDGGAMHSEEAYSRGTRDLYAFAVRLALSDALYVGELPPILLDDPFTAFDDEKLKRALGLLGRIAKERQVIYFTCQKSRTPS